MTFELSITLIGICRAVTMLVGGGLTFVALTIAIDSDGGWRSLLVFLVGLSLLLIGIFA